jgi:glycosyltransferase involved in cell wall biosynthesis
MASMLSVVIPCLDAEGTVGEQLGALSAQACPGWDGRLEVVVADNGSTDGSRRVVESFSSRLPGLRSLDAGQRRGAAYARNAGVRAARGDRLAFVDADDVVAPGWLAAIDRALDGHDFVASRFDLARLNPVPVIHPQARGLQRAALPPYLQHAGGSGLAIHRALHEKVGGFDETLARLHDTDYCFRVQLAGARLHFAADAVVYVRERKTPVGVFVQMRQRALHAMSLARRYEGHPSVLTTEWATFARRCAGELSWLLRIRSRNDWFEWMRNLGWLAGLAQGSVRYRRAPLRKLVE